MRRITDNRYECGGKPQTWSSSAASLHTTNLFHVTAAEAPAGRCRRSVRLGEGRGKSQSRRARKKHNLTPIPSLFSFLHHSSFDSHSDLIRGACNSVVTLHSQDLFIAAQVWLTAFFTSPSALFLYRNSNGLKQCESHQPKPTSRHNQPRPPPNLISRCLRVLRGYTKSPNPSGIRNLTINHFSSTG